MHMLGRRRSAAPEPCHAVMSVHFVSRFLTTAWETTPMGNYLILIQTSALRYEHGSVTSRPYYDRPRRTKQPTDGHELG